jgi:cytochrome c-type biogenesis protein CcmH/NrfG
MEMSFLQRAVRLLVVQVVHQLAVAAADHLKVKMFIARVVLAVVVVLVSLLSKQINLLVVLSQVQSAGISYHKLFYIK